MPIKSSYHLLEAQKFERCDLISKTKAIKQEFTHFLAQLQQHMLNLIKDGTLDISVIKNRLVVYNRRLKSPVCSCESLQDIFEILRSPDHCSFLDYDLIKLFVDYGSGKVRSDFIEYKKKLQRFLKDRIIESSSGEAKSYVIVTDESITDEITDFVQFQNQVKSILGQRNLTFMNWEELSFQSESKVSSIKKGIIQENAAPSQEDMIAITATQINSEEDILPISEKDTFTAEINFLTQESSNIENSILHLEHAEKEEVISEATVMMQSFALPLSQGTYIACSFIKL